MSGERISTCIHFSSSQSSIFLQSEQPKSLQQTVKGVLYLFRNDAGQIRSGWMIFFGILIMLTGQFVFMLPGITFMSILEITEHRGAAEANFTTMSPLMLLMTQGAGTFGGLAATLVAWRSLNKRPLKELGIRGLDLDFLFGLILGALSITLIFIILYGTGQVTLLNSFSDPQISTYTFTFLIMFILVAFFEELFFRGYVMRIMESRGNQKWLIYVVSALLFSIAHGMNPNVSLFGLINIALIGILFAYMFDVTKSLMLPIGYHITWNFFQGNVFEFPVSGASLYGMYDIDTSSGNVLLTGGEFGLEGGILATLMIALGFVATHFYAKVRYKREVESR